MSPESFSKEIVLSFVRYMNNLERTKKDDYFLFRHPKVNYRWLTEKELFDSFIAEEEFFNKALKFAGKFSEVIYQIRIEGEWLYQYESYSPEFAKSIVDNEFHSESIQFKIKENLLDGIYKEWYIPNENGEFEYCPEMMDAADFMEDYIEKIWREWYKKD